MHVQIPMVTCFKLGDVWCSSVSCNPAPPTADSGLKYSIRLQDLNKMKDLNRGTCWKDLFPGTILADGFPASSCPGMYGLQIPLGPILELADIRYDVSLEDDGGVITAPISTGCFGSSTQRRITRTDKRSSGTLGSSRSAK